MIKRSIILLLLLIPVISGMSQTNMFLTNPRALEVLQGDYDPSDYLVKAGFDHPDSVKLGLINDISPQRFVELLNTLETFYNRNSGSDTLSLTTGIGACRTWILSEFDRASRDNNNRLVTGYLEFDAEICGCMHHKNPFALLPGTDTSLREIIIVEGHFDTRNEGRCDTEGYTPGIDDNGSGTVLVMEMARLMSKYQFRRSILFTTPTGEDQGLWGATAWANYLSAQGIEIAAVLNNDIVGGIYCGKKSSPPSCPYWGHVDSTHVRIFSYSPNNSSFSSSPHKQLARYTKYVQEELINPYLSTPMTVNLMLGEDRDGRGGDHTPFRRKGYTAIRIISANEHGDGSGAEPDRIHSTRDLLGLDIDNDGVLDSLFVNPGYLSRNALMNGVTAALIASAPETPQISLEPAFSGAKIHIENLPDNATKVLVGTRVYANRNIYFDRLEEYPPSDIIEVDLSSGDRNFVCVSVVSEGAPSLFSNELQMNLTGFGSLFMPSGIELLQNAPNPWNDRTSTNIRCSLANIGQMHN